MAKHKIHKGQLRSKGWSEEEIAKAEKILERAESSKDPLVARLDQSVFWLLLVIVVVGMASVSALVMPLLLLLDQATFFLILVLLGLTLGTLFTIIIQDLHWLARYQHVLAMLFLPVAAAAVLVLMLRIVSAAVTSLAGHSITLVAFVFSLSILAPYLFHMATAHRRRMAS